MRAGMLGELRSPEALLAAVRALKKHGYRRLDAFTPYPVHGLEEELGLPRSRLGWMVFPLGLLGAALGFLVQWWCNAIDYPLNVGGRPPASIPAFIPITFESGVLVTGLSGVLFMLALCRLPELHAPLFEVPGFGRSAVDTFWVGVDELDPRFDEAAIARVLSDAGAVNVARARGDST